MRPDGGGTPAAAGLCDLDSDALLHVLRFLGPDSLSALCCASTRLSAAASHPSLWRQLCTARWAHLNHAALPPLRGNCGGADGGDWKRLWSGGNGWLPPGQLHHSSITPGGDFITALRPAPLPASGQGSGGTLLAVADAEALQVWRVHSPPGRRRVYDGDGDSSSSHSSGVPQRHSLLAAAQLPDSTMTYALAMVYGGDGSGEPELLAAGNSRGELDLYRLDSSSLFRDGDEGAGSGRDAGPGPVEAASAALPPRRRPLPRLVRLHTSRSGPATPLVDLQAHAQSGLLVGLHDATFSMVDAHAVPGLPALGAARNRVRIYDLRAQREVASVADCFESHEFMCFDAWGPPSSSSGFELVAGSVHGGYCRHCFAAGTPSLCFHKAQVGQRQGSGRCVCWGQCGPLAMSFLRLYLG